MPQQRVTTLQLDGVVTVCDQTWYRSSFPNNDAPNIGAYAMPAAADDDRALFDGDGRNVDNGNNETDVKCVYQRICRL